jgi:GntR family transcriptional regulator, rspAB operon transcriptional repressor
MDNAVRKEQDSSESRTEFVYRNVRNMILRGELKPGRPLSRRSIALRLGVSFLPVTEALQRLEYDGLLESKPRAGTRVKIPTLDEVWGTFIIREALETMSARLFTSAAQPSERMELLERAAELDELISVGRVIIYDYNGLHESFHRLIAKGAKCSGLEAALERTHAIQQSWVSIGVTDLSTILRPNHVSLVGVLNGNDAEAASRTMRVHIIHGREDVMRGLRTRFAEGENADTPMKRGGSRFGRRGAAEREAKAV